MSAELGPFFLSGPMCSGVALVLVPVTHLAFSPRRREPRLKNDTRFFKNEACCLTAVAKATILVPYHVVKSLQLIWRLGTRRWNLRVPKLQMNCSDLKIRHPDISCSNSHQDDVLYHFELMPFSRWDTVKSSCICILWSFVQSVHKGYKTDLEWWCHKLWMMMSQNTIVMLLLGDVVGMRAQHKNKTSASYQYQIRSLITRYCKILNLWDRVLKCSKHFEIYHLADAPQWHLPNFKVIGELKHKSEAFKNWKILQ